MTTVPTFSDDILDMGLDAYERSVSMSGPRFYAITGRTDAYLQFLSNPWDIPKDTDGKDLDWVNYREVRAFNGLRTGDKMPGGLAVFPAADRKMSRSSQTGNPIIVTVNDPLMELVEPGRYDKDGRVGAWPVRAINAIFIGGVIGEKDPTYEPTPGQHIIVKLSKHLSGKLKAKLQERRDEDPDFDATQFVWKISVIGEGATSDVKATKSDKSLSTESVELVDINTVINDIRMRAEIAVSNLLGGTASAVAPPPVVADIDDVDEAVANLTAAGLLDGSDDFFHGVSDARLRKMIADAGAVAPRGASREILVNLALEAGVSA